VTLIDIKFRNLKDLFVTLPLNKETKLVAKLGLIHVFSFKNGLITCNILHIIKKLNKHLMTKPRFSPCLANLLKCLTVSVTGVTYLKYKSRNWQLGSIFELSHKVRLNLKLFYLLVLKGYCSFIIFTTRFINVLHHLNKLSALDHIQEFRQLDRIPVK